MTQQGWECPKCGTVYAPWQPKCQTCVAGAVTTAVTFPPCDHQWVSDTFGTRCMKCGQQSQYAPMCYDTGDEIPPKYENTCETRST